MIGGPERRNPFGWILIGALVIFMVAGQLSSYLTRSPSSELERARIEEALQTSIGMESLSGASSTANRGRLIADAAILKPDVAQDPKTALLYAAVQTELGSPPKVVELTALRSSKVDADKAAYEIYSSPRLDRPRAAALAKRIPPTSFLNKLVAAQALEKAGDRAPRQALSGQSGAVAKIVAGSILLLLGLLGGILIFLYGIFRARGDLVPKGFAVGPLTMADADRLALRCGQIFVVFLGMAMFGGAAVRQYIDKDFLELPIYSLIVILVVLLSAAPVDGRMFRLRSLGITGESIGKHVAWGVGAALANIPILIIVQSISMWVFRGLPAAEHPVTVELADTNSIVVILQLAVIASVFAPFIEEIMFRGTLFPALAKVLKSPIWAGVVSSLIFATIHPTGIPAWPGLAAIGGMSCFLAYQTKSLVPSMVMHATNNFGVLAFTLIFLH